METYTLHVAGVTRELPICPVSDKMSIAAFVMLGDVELTKACAAALLPKCPDFDVLLTAECKGIPLAYEMSAMSGKPHVIARKEKKVYTIDPIEVVVRSITTQHEQKLVLGRDDVEKLRGKRVMIVDDVISTGESLEAQEKLVEPAGDINIGKAAVLAEGDAAEREDIQFLEELPLIFT